MRSFLTALILTIFAVVQLAPADFGAREQGRMTQASLDAANLDAAGALHMSDPAEYRTGGADQAMSCCEADGDPETGAASASCSADCMTLLPVSLALTFPGGVHAVDPQLTHVSGQVPPRAERPPQTV